MWLNKYYSFIILLATDVIINCQIVNDETVKHAKVSEIIKWTSKVLKSQDKKRLKAFSDVSDSRKRYTNKEMYGKYYEMAAKPLESPCKIFKKIGGQWMGDAFSGKVLFDNLKIV